MQHRSLYMYITPSIGMSNILGYTVYYVALFLAPILTPYTIVMWWVNKQREKSLNLLKRFCTTDIREGFVQTRPKYAHYENQTLN